MHFHLPKPLHGWREFAGEVGIIVIGVLIALGAEQVVESFHWQSRAKDAQRAIDAELTLNAGDFDVRTMLAPCTSHVLQQITTVIANARKSGGIGNIEAFPGGWSTPILTTAWDSAVSEGVTSHIPEDRRREYATLYNEIGIYRAAINEENRLWAHLRLLQNSPGKISDALVADIAASTAELRYHERLDDIIAEQGLVEMRELRIKPDYGFFTGDPGTMGHGTRDDVRRNLFAAELAGPHCKRVLEDGSEVAIQVPKQSPERR